jgi:hypothetical protein
MSALADVFPVFQIGGIVVFQLVLGVIILVIARTQDKSRATGATPVQPARQLPPAGWYEDPGREARLRWWDGTRWTEHTAE